MAKGTVRGQCQGRDGSPLSSVRVNLLQNLSVVAPEAKTPADGTFTFDGLPPGKYLLTFQHVEQRTWQREIELASGATAELGLVQPGPPPSGR